MALVKGTNSYSSYDEADDYLQDRTEETAWEAASGVEQDSALVTAFHVLDNLPWVGITGSATQPMAWPRTASVYSTSRGRVVNYLGTETEAPTLVKQAQYELALHFLSNPGVTGGSGSSTSGGEISSLSVGEIEVKYSSPVAVVSSRVRIPRHVINLVKDYLSRIPGSTGSPVRSN